MSTLRPTSLRAWKEVIDDMAFLDLQALKRPGGGGGGGSRLSVTGCPGESSLSLLLCE